ncbi:MAG: hydroxymethylbilane synthase [Bacteroidetes bacterium]|nr:hydroxymethylbilane synthase [Bacteroidota bacterium]
MNSTIRIGTRESELAVWQATLVQELLADKGYTSTLVYIKSEGDIDLKTPLYEMGVQGIFTRSLDIALLNNSIDIAVHSMKDVPTQLPGGIVQGAVLERGNYKDLLVMHPFDESAEQIKQMVNAGERESGVSALPLSIATSSIRRKAQWLHRFPGSQMEDLRGNVNTRLRKLQDSKWNGAIFAAAGLERINLRPENSMELNWMLPAPAQGAVVAVCREADEHCTQALSAINHSATEICTAIEREFLRTLMGGCSTPISALATIVNDEILFKGNILSTDGRHKASIEKSTGVNSFSGFGQQMAMELLANGGRAIAETMNNAR